jgi:hypothetical protein
MPRPIPDDPPVTIAFLFSISQEVSKNWALQPS